MSRRALGYLAAFLFSALAWGALAFLARCLIVMHQAVTWMHGGRLL